MRIAPGLGPIRTGGIESADAPELRPPVHHPRHRGRRPRQLAGDLRARHVVPRDQLLPTVGPGYRGPRGVGPWRDLGDPAVRIGAHPRACPLVRRPLARPRRPLHHPVHLRRGLEPGWRGEAAFDRVRRRHRRAFDERPDRRRRLRHVRRAVGLARVGCRLFVPRGHQLPARRLQPDPWLSPGRWARAARHRLVEHRQPAAGDRGGGRRRPDRRLRLPAVGLRARDRQRPVRGHLDRGHRLVPPGRRSVEPPAGHPRAAPRSPAGQ